MSYQPPPPPPGGGYGQQPGYGAPQPQNSKKAVWALVLGILSILCCGLLAGIPAVILGRQAKQEGGGGMATAGEILGYIGIALSVLWIILALTGNAVWKFDTN
jgi:hypothetical protein